MDFYTIVEYIGHYTLFSYKYAMSNVRFCAFIGLARGRPMQKAKASDYWCSYSCIGALVRSGKGSAANVDTEIKKK